MTGHVRYVILGMLFLASALSYADRSALSVTKGGMAEDLGVDPVAMGYLLSAFGWSYVAGQLPAGGLLDRFGSRRVYGLAILLWSAFTLLQGGAGYLTGAAAFAGIFALGLLVGLAESPAFPGNSRVVSAWFPTKERGTASAIFNASQYFSTVLFLPLMAWITYAAGWRAVFFVMGTLGVAVGLIWFRVVRDPAEHPWVTPAELDHIRRGGGLVTMDRRAGNPIRREHLRLLLTNRMLVGVYIAQYCINTLTYFFLTWFPGYLVSHGMSIVKAGVLASLPALCGLAGGILGGAASDAMVRHGWSLTVARKTPIVVGLLLSCTMVACNYLSPAWVIPVMCLAYFGKGLGALGWTVVSDTSPKEVIGLCGGLFNTFGNAAAITTPIVIGYLVKSTGGFNAALVFVGLNAVGAILCYLLVVGKIRRLELGPPAPGFEVLPAPAEKATRA